MAIFVVRRLIGTIPVLILVSIIVFLFLHLSPGDPVTVLMGEERGDPQTIAALRAKLGLDRSWPEQYLLWAKGVLEGDWGFSFRSHMPVSQAIWTRLGTTVELTIAAMMLSLIVALPLGISAAVHRNSWLDFVNSVVAGLGNSMPNFWLGILLIYLFAVGLHWLPPSGYVPITEDVGGNVKSMILPTITLAAGYFAVITRMVRSSLLEVLRDDYVRTARGKGLAENVVLNQHALKNALIPIVTIVGMETGRLLGGAVVTETIFALPGIGRLIVDAVLTRDFPIVQALTLLMTLALLLSNLVVDVLYAYLDPRIRYD